MSTDTESDRLARLLRASRLGDSAAQSELFTVLHREMCGIAAALLRREYRPVTFATGDLVNEAVLKLIQSRSTDANDRAHFLSIAARAMRQVLVDAGRKRHAEKRHRLDVTLTENRADVGAPEMFSYRSLETAIIRLRSIDQDRADFVVLRYYGGMSLEEIATVLGVSESTVKRSWKATRAWLREAIENDPSG